MRPRCMRNALTRSPIASTRVGSGGGAGTPGGNENRPDGGPDGGPDTRSERRAGRWLGVWVSSAIRLQEYRQGRVSASQSCCDPSVLLREGMKARGERFELGAMAFEGADGPNAHQIVDAAVFLEHVSVEEFGHAVELRAHDG